MAADVGTPSRSQPPGQLDPAGHRHLAARAACRADGKAIRALMDEAANEHDVHRFRLAISPTNAPSTSLAMRLGFDCVGEQVDPDDGLELLYEQHWPPTGT